MVQTFVSDGVEIAYRDEGTGAPVVLVHGFASNMSVNWIGTGWVRELVAAGYRVIAIDNRGHGDSEKLYDVEAYGARLMAGDVARLLEHLGLTKAVVMGYSMGARITAFLAIDHPGRVHAAVFSGLGYNMVRGLGGSEAIAAALDAPSIADVDDQTGRMFRAFAEQTGSDLKALSACIRSSRTPITPDDLATLALPVLVAVGSEDAVGGSPGDLAALIPKGEAVVIQGRDHMKAVGDRAHKSAVFDFLARMGGPASGWARGKDTDA